MHLSIASSNLLYIYVYLIRLVTEINTLLREITLELLKMHRLHLVLHQYLVILINRVRIFYCIYLQWNREDVNTIVFTLLGYSQAISHPMTMLWWEVM